MKTTIKSLTRIMQSSLLALLCVALHAPFIAPVYGQSGGSYTLNRFAIAGGGGTSTAGTQSITGTIGQGVIGDSSGGSYSMSGGFIPYGFTEYEADVAPRPNGNGNGLVTASDYVQIGRFAAGLATPDSPTSSNEFQRADCAPISTFGNGRITASDYTQAGRYAAGLDSVRFANGASVPVAPFSEPRSVSESENGKVGQSGSGSVLPVSFNRTKSSASGDNQDSAAGAPTNLSVVNRTATAGTTVPVSILLDAQGIENTFGFSVTYDQTKLTFVSATIGSTPQASGGSIREMNVQQANGRAGFLIAKSVSATPPSFPAGVYELISISFMVASNAATGNTTIGFGDQPVFRETVTADVQDVPTTYTPGTVNIMAPTAAPARVGGRVALANGSGVSGVPVTLTGANGLQQTVTTAANGSYIFNPVPLGELYVVTPDSSLYTFSPPGNNVFLLADELNVNFTAMPQAPQGAGDLLISEFRLRGAQGARDEFIELYNNSDAALTVTPTDGSAGWSAVTISNGGATAQTLFTIPAGTVIPARAHLLAANVSNTPGEGYSLSTYAAPDITFTTEIADDSSVSVFRTSNPANFNVATRLDSVGFSGNGSNGSNGNSTQSKTPQLSDAKPMKTTITPVTANRGEQFREGGGLAPIGAVDGEYSFVRRVRNGRPVDTNDNVADFVLVSTTGATIGTTPSVLGAPGPENANSPVTRTLNILRTGLLDATVSSSLAPNRVIDATPVANGANGTMEIRRRVTNTGSSPVTRLRFRITDITTLNSPITITPQADLRVLSSSDMTVTLANGTPVPVRGLIVEEVSPQAAAGGGLNTSAIVATITTAQPLAAGETANVRFRLGLERQGRFRFIVTVEALQ